MGLLDCDPKADEHLEGCPYHPEAKQLTKTVELDAEELASINAYCYCEYMRKRTDGNPIYWDDESGAYDIHWPPELVDEPCPDMQPERVQAFGTPPADEYEAVIDAGIWDYWTPKDQRKHLMHLSSNAKPD